MLPHLLRLLLSTARPLIDEFIPESIVCGIRGRGRCRIAQALIRFFPELHISYIVSGNWIDSVPFDDLIERCLASTAVLFQGLLAIAGVNLL